MIVKVEQCWGGRNTYFQLKWKGGWQNINSEKWDRKTATEALDTLESVYGLNRRNIRFRHR